VSAHGGGSHHLHSQFVAQVERLGVEIVKHFHVVADEADGRDDEFAGTGGVALPDVVEDIGFEPRLRWRATAALPHQLVVFGVERGGDVRAGLVELLDVRAGGGHGEGHAVRRENEVRLGVELGEGFADAFGLSVEEAGVVPELGRGNDRRGTFADLGGGALNVLFVLLAAGVGAEG